jgi:hypothetical protein
VSVVRPRRIVGIGDSGSKACARSRCGGRGV